MTKIQGAIDLPFQAVSNIKSSINLVADQFEQLVTTIGNLAGLSVNDKKYVEAQGANLISSLVRGTTSELVVYDTPDEVQFAIDRIIDQFNNYVEVLDEMLNDQGDLNSYFPDQNSYLQVQQLLFYGISRLEEIILESNDEYIIYAEADTNAIIMTHRVYGADASDERLDYFIRSNNLTQDELLLIPRGRELKYYI
jgi:hypothetical protein